jgi:hypothetical protein
MDSIEKFLHKIAYKFPKGYPDINDLKDKALLFELIGEVPTKKPLLAESFEKNIENVFKGEVPQAYGNYQIKPGPFKLDPRDVEPFKRLFLENDGKKDVGNGEISLYWLFNNSGGTAQENRGVDKPDLIINGDAVEVKAYPTHSTKIGVGKFKQDIESRTIITRLFGVQNLTTALRGVEEKAFVSEVSFNLGNLKNSFDKVIEMNNVLSRPELQSILGEFETFKQLNEEIKFLVNLVPGGDSKTLAKYTMGTLIGNKLKRKPGEGQYVLNLLTGDPTNMYIWQMPQDITSFITKQSYEQLDQDTGVSSAEIKVKFTIFD